MGSDFITVTNGPNGREFDVHVRYIMFVHPNTGPDPKVVVTDSIIQMVGGLQFNVRESVEQVRALINSTRKLGSAAILDFPPSKGRS